MKQIGKLISVIVILALAYFIYSFFTNTSAKYEQYEHAIDSLTHEVEVLDSVHVVQDSVIVVYQDSIIYLDNIREEMFNTEHYDTVTAKEVMRKPSMIIDSNEDIFSIMKKFEESGQWNLPVVKEGIYIGFLSKSSILDKYRNELLVTV
jgi:signal-transduction protein with cAMP-binding, CBS, and nucleotidyltransferase domain